MFVESIDGFGIFCRTQDSTMLVIDHHHPIDLTDL